jgi:cardiolipin synthase
MSLGIAAFYYRYASLPAPKTFMRYWDFSLPSAEVHPTQISKWNTFLQLGLIGCTVVEPLVTASGILSAIDLQTNLQGLQYLVAGTTLWSGASYLWTRDAVVILGDDEVLKKKQGFRGRATIGISFAAFVALAVYFAVKEEPKETTSADD